jgi:hypothetical protein
VLCASRTLLTTLEAAIQSHTRVKCKMDSMNGEWWWWRIVLFADYDEIVLYD